MTDTTTESKLPVSYLSVNGESREIVDAAARKDIEGLKVLTGEAKDSSIYTEGNFQNIDDRLENIEGVLHGLETNEEKNLKSEIKGKNFNSVDDRFEDIEAEIVNARTSIDSSTYNDVGTRIGTIETEIIEARKSDKEEKTYDTLGTRIKTIEEDVSDINKTYYLRPLFYKIGSFDKDKLNFSKDGNDNYKILLKDGNSNNIEIKITESDLLDKYQEEMEVTVSAAISNGNNEIPIEKIDDIVTTTTKEEDGKIISLTVSFTGKISASVYENDIDFPGSSTLYLWYAVWQGLESLELAQARTSCFDFEKKNNLRQRLNIDFDYAANAIKVDKENKQLTVQPGTSGGVKDQTIWQWMSDNYNTNGTIDTTEKTVGAVIWNWLTANYDKDDVISTTDKTISAAIWNWLTANYDLTDSTKDVVGAINSWLRDEVDDDTISTAIEEFFNNPEKVEPLVSQWVEGNWGSGGGTDVKAVINNWLTDNYATYRIDDDGKIIINIDTTEKTVGAVIWNWLTANYDKDDVISTTDKTIGAAIWNWLTANYATYQDGVININDKTVGAAIVNWLKTEEGVNYLANSFPYATLSQNGLMSKEYVNTLDEVDSQYNTLVNNVRKNAWSSEDLNCVLKDTQTTYENSANGTWVVENIRSEDWSLKGIYQGTTTDKILFFGPCSFYVTNIGANGFYGKIKNYNLADNDKIEYTIFIYTEELKHTTLRLKNNKNDIDIHIDTSDTSGSSLVGDKNSSDGYYKNNLVWYSPFAIRVKPVSSTT